MHTMEQAGNKKVEFRAKITDKWLDEGLRLLGI